MVVMSAFSLRPPTSTALFQNPMASAQAIVRCVVAVAAMLIPVQPAPAADAPQNFVVIFADDLGYGDLGCYGHPTIRTPHLDRMAAEGVRFTQFYSAAEVCTPSRAALLTGRLPPRSGMCSDNRRVFFHNSSDGLPAEEITIARLLKPHGYATACIGKWHLGHLPQFLPTAHGFDTYFGIPYSNDMDRVAGVGPNGREAFLQPKPEYWNVPLMRDEQIIERPADQTTITRRYTEEATQFIRAHKAEPFFVYLPHTMSHVPLFRSKAFVDHSRRGLYGDVVEELDWSVGQILQTLRDEGLAENTLVWFTADNGPWLIFGDHGGSAGLLKDGKGSTWEGGMRVPGIAWQPGRIPGGRDSTELASTLDFLPTFAAMAGVAPPTDRKLDGYDLSGLLVKDEPSPRKSMFYYRGPRLMAVRHGPWKAHFMTQAGYGPEAKNTQTHDPPLLYHLEQDPSERENRSATQPEVLAEIKQIVAEHQAGMEIPPTRLDAVLPAAP